MITGRKPKLTVVAHLREAGYRVHERPATDAETLFRRLYKQTDTTIPRDAVEKCFRAAGYDRFPTPEAIDEAMRHLQILADSANITIPKSSSRGDVIRATKPYLKALKAASKEWAYYLGRTPPNKYQASDIREIADAIRLAKNICSRRVAIDDSNARKDWEQRVVRVAMIGRGAWESVGKPPRDTTNPDTSRLVKFVVAAMELLGNPRRPKEDVKRAKGTHTAEGEVAYVLRKHKRRFSF